MHFNIIVARMRFKFGPPFSLWFPLLTIFLHHIRSTSSLNCDKTFTYYEEYGQNSFNVTCNGITKGYEHILENITINNEISLTITDSILENLTPNIFKNVRNIRILGIYNSTFEFDRKLSIFNKLDKLQNLVIQDSYFEIENITLKGLQSLKTLELNNNSLSAIEIGGFRDLISLEKLELINNHVKNMEDLQLCELQNLKSLILRNNFISNLKLFYFFCLKKHKSLDFDINDMPALPNFYPNSYLNVTTPSYDLVDLDLSYNLLPDVGYSFEGLRKLRFLNLGFNKLVLIKNNHFKTLDKLEKFILKNNQIRTFDSRVFENKTRLYLVDLSYNHLKELGVSNVPKLQLINLSYNNLTSIWFKNLTSLKEMNLEYNNLKDLASSAFVKVPKLVRLNLAGNSLVLSSGLFENIQGLRFLYLNNNSLRNVPEKAFLGLTNLRSLDLSNNDLTSLNVNTFHDLANLEILNLSSNSIELLPYLVIEPLHNLRSLDVSANKLQYIEYDVILSKIPGLININIKSNLLACEGLAKMIVYFKQRHIGYTNTEHMDAAKMNQNIAGIPCRAANKNFIVKFETKSKGSSAMVNFGISILIVLVAVVTGIVSYKFYIYLKRRKYRADEFELVDE